MVGGCAGGGVGQGNGWSVDRSEETEMRGRARAGAASCFFRGRGQLDDLVLGGLTDDVFIGGGGREREREKLDLKI